MYRKKWNGFSHTSCNNYNEEKSTVHNYIMVKKFLPFLCFSGHLEGGGPWD